MNFSLKDRLTLGLAGLASATALTVIISEIIKIFKNKKKEVAPEEVAEVVTEAAAEVAVSGYQASPERERVLFNILNGFIIGGAGSRIIAIGIRDGWWPVKNVHVKDKHIHHFIPGMLITGAAAGTSFFVNSKHKSKLAFMFGLGAGMTLDESALLLDLKDVYWTKEGLLSIQLSLGVTAVLGGTVIALRMIDRGEDIIDLGAEN
jgi:hypothetical protein